VYIHGPVRPRPLFSHLLSRSYKECWEQRERGREVRNEEFRIISWSLYELPVFKELLLLDGIC
jgi:hypothetical protein